MLGSAGREDWPGFCFVFTFNGGIMSEDFFFPPKRILFLNFLPKRIFFLTKEDSIYFLPNT